jgi:hypothetical protein
MREAIGSSRINKLVKVKDKIRNNKTISSHII